MGNRCIIAPQFLNISAFLAGRLALLVIQVLLFGGWLRGSIAGLLFLVCICQWVYSKVDELLRMGYSCKVEYLIGEINVCWKKAFKYC